MAQTAGFRWKLDLRPQALAQVRAAAADGVTDGVEHLLEEANRTVPIEEAILEGSGDTDVDADALQGSVFYDTAYAARQHEDLGLGHDPGRRAKWLELTFQERASAVQGWLADKIRGAFR